MSHPTFWPKKSFFYPIGNTPPVSLTDHLPPEGAATILLLGCGDPRHILYTITTDHGLRKYRFDSSIILYAHSRTSSSLDGLHLL
jgi:hypothetical protein